MTGISRWMTDGGVLVSKEHSMAWAPARIGIQNVAEQEDKVVEIPSA